MILRTLIASTSLPAPLGAALFPPSPSTVPYVLLNLLHPFEVVRHVGPCLCALQAILCEPPQRPRQIERVPPAKAAHSRQLPTPMHALHHGTAVRARFLPSRRRPRATHCASTVRWGPISPPLTQPIAIFGLFVQPGLRSFKHPRQHLIGRVRPVATGPSAWGRHRAARGECVGRARRHWRSHRHRPTGRACHALLAQHSTAIREACAAL
jgi:hypothetical protein